MSSLTRLSLTLRFVACVAALAQGFPGSAICGRIEPTRIAGSTSKQQQVSSVPDTPAPRSTQDDSATSWAGAARSEALIAADRMNFAEAERLLKGVITGLKAQGDSEPQLLSSALCDLGYVLLRQGQFADAQQSFESVLSGTPDDAVVREAALRGLNVAQQNQNVERPADTSGPRAEAGSPAGESIQQENPVVAELSRALEAGAQPPALFNATIAPASKPAESRENPLRRGSRINLGGVDYSKPQSALWNFGAYRPVNVPEAEFSDSARLDRLIRNGKLYLSLPDAVALALENNLDIQVARYSPLEVQADLMRAKSGANLSGVQTQISTLSTAQSAQGGGGAGFTASPRGQATGITQSASASAQGIGSAGNAASFFGTQTINLEPQLTSTVTMARSSNPQISNFVTGTNNLISETSATALNFSKGFISGTTLGARLSTFRQESNNIRNSFNPTLTSDFSVFFTQRLLQGFGPAINSRNIHIAKNNQEIEDLNFEQQVITTISRLEALYWDLVTFRNLAEARRLDVELAERLVRQAHKKAELGLEARIEVTRAEAEASSFRQQLAQAETSVREQAILLKNALTKHGPTSATLLGVELVPTSSIYVPDEEPVEPVQDLVQDALRARVELVRTRMNLTNSDISLRGIKNALKPSVDVTAFATTNGLAGAINRNLATLPGLGAPPADELFVGGLGTALSQITRARFPDYGVQFQLNIPLTNRAAQADMTRELLRRRRSDVQVRQEENAIKVDVAQAVADVDQARTVLETSTDARRLREEMVAAEEKRFGLGLSTVYQIIQAQRDLSSARTTEINALNQYEAARNQLDFAVGRTLRANNVSIDEAYSGKVSRPSDPLPPGEN